MAKCQGEGDTADPDRDRKEAGPSTNVDGPADARKPYVKPAFRFERVFETTALACAKITATQGQCRLNRKIS